MAKCRRLGSSDVAITALLTPGRIVGDFPRNTPLTRSLHLAAGALTTPCTSTPCPLGPACACQGSEVPGYPPVGTKLALCWYALALCGIFSCGGGPQSMARTTSLDSKSRPMPEAPRARSAADRSSFGFLRECSSLRSSYGTILLTLVLSTGSQPQYRAHERGVSRVFAAMRNCPEFAKWGSLRNIHLAGIPDRSARRSPHRLHT